MVEQNLNFHLLNGVRELLKNENLHSWRAHTISTIVCSGKLEGHVACLLTKSSDPLKGRGV